MFGLAKTLRRIADAIEHANELSVDEGARSARQTAAFDAKMDVNMAALGAMIEARDKKLNDWCDVESQKMATYRERLDKYYGEWLESRPLPLMSKASTKVN